MAEGKGGTEFIYTPWSKLLGSPEENEAFDAYIKAQFHTLGQLIAGADPNWVQTLIQVASGLANDPDFFAKQNEKIEAKIGPEYWEQRVVFTGVDAEFYTWQHPIRIDQILKPDVSLDLSFQYWDVIANRWQGFSVGDTLPVWSRWRALYRENPVRFGDDQWEIPLASYNGSYRQVLLIGTELSEP